MSPSSALPRTGAAATPKPHALLASPAPWSIVSSKTTRNLSGALHWLRFPPTSFARILQNLSKRETVRSRLYSDVPAGEKSWASIPRKAPSVATWISYWMPAVGPLSVDSIQFRRTGPLTGLKTWMSMSLGSSPMGSEGGTWSLRKSGLFVFGAASVPNASIQELNSTGYVFEYESSTRHRQS